jgi:hypothetical protein
VIVMDTELRSLPTVTQGARRSILTLEDVAENVARRHTLACIKYPEAVTLTGRLTFSIYETLRREKDSGLHSEKFWREMKAGEKALPLFDVARLVYGSTAERLAAMKFARIYVEAAEHATRMAFLERP